MRPLLVYLLTHLVEDRDAVQIEETDEDRRKVYRVRVAPEDRGRVIGKNGSTINSVRSVIAAAAGDGIRTRVEIVD